MPYPGLLHPVSLSLWQAITDPYLHRRHSSTQRQIWLSLCGVSWCVCLSPPVISGGYGVWFSMQFCPSNHLSGTSPLTLEVRYLFLVQFNILLLMVVQQQVVNLEFSQEKMSTCPSTQPSFNLSPASKQQVTELSYNESTQSRSALCSHRSSIRQPPLWTWNNTLVPNRKRSTSKVYVVTLLI